MTNAGTPTRILRVDPEHGGIRLSVLVTLAIGSLVGFFLIRMLLGWLLAGTPLADFLTVMSCVGAVPFALGCAWLVERYLKNSWTSGINIELDSDELRLTGVQTMDADTDSIVLDWAKRVNQTRWHFRLANYPKAGRERLVPDKWLCLACQMQQDDRRIIAYTYAPPEQAQAWLERAETVEPFHAISLAQLYRAADTRRWGATTRPEVPTEMLTGPNGRYWIAERRRWAEGVELAPEDFDALLDFIEAHTEPFGAATQSPSGA